MAEFKEQLKEFITTNNVIGITAGVCIGSVTKDAVASLVKDIIFPFIVIFLNNLNIKYLSKFIKEHNKLNSFDFLKQMTTWAITIVVTYLFIKYAFLDFLGIDKKSLEKKKE
jgi:large-conductance mechanosensitive channel